MYKRTVYYAFPVMALLGALWTALTVDVVRFGLCAFAAVMFGLAVLREEKAGGDHELGDDERDHSSHRVAGG